MTTLIVKVDDDRTESLKKILQEIPYVHAVEEDAGIRNNPETQYELKKKILDKAEGRNLFEEIEGPVEWQRAIRKEWDRDFNNTIPLSGGQEA